MREKQELLKREGERERDASSLSIYARWGGVIRDDGNIKSGERAGPAPTKPQYRMEIRHFCLSLESFHQQFVSQFNLFTEANQMAVHL